MIPRALAETLRGLAQGFSVVGVTGPRQSGKTTAGAVCADNAYLLLEGLIERAFAVDGSRGFLARCEHGAAFDEAQRWPDLFSFLQGLVDAEREPSLFVPTGSQQIALLTGRARRANATVPARVCQGTRRFAATEHPLDDNAGRLPASPRPAFHGSRLDRQLRRQLRRARCTESAERVPDLGAFQRFLRLCAGGSGQSLNLSALVGEAGFSHSAARA